MGVWAEVAVAATDMTDLAHLLGTDAGICQATGIDFSSYRPLVMSAYRLGGRIIHTKRRWRDDQAMMDAVSDLTLQVAVKGQQLHSVHGKVAAAYQAEQDKEEPNEAVLEDCEFALELIVPARAALQLTMRDLVLLPDLYEDTYEAIHEEIRKGVRLSVDGRFHTPEPLDAPRPAPRFVLTKSHHPRLSH